MRGLADLEKFGNVAGEVVFPLADESQATRYIIWSVKLRDPSLDASTVRNYCNGISAAHEALRGALKLPALLNPIRTSRVRRMLKVAMNEYKKPSKAKQHWTLAEFKAMLEKGFKKTRSGRHQRLALWVHALGVVRKSAGGRLTVRYRVRPGPHGRPVVQWHPKSQVQVHRGDHAYISVKVTRDKNVSAWKHRETFIPEQIKVLGFSPVAELEEYMVRERPPSGGFLLAAPLGKSKFRTTPYSNQSNAFKTAYEVAHGLAKKSARSAKYGSQSCRKSMAQWLWDDDWDKRVIADHGGWALQRDAVDIYFKTGRVKMLWAITHLGHVQRKREHLLKTKGAPQRGNATRRDGDR